MVADDPRLAALVASLTRAAERRGMTAVPTWAAARDALDDWLPGGDAGDLGRDVDGRLDELRAVFGLSEVAASMLLVAAAAELDPNIALIYGLLLGADGPRPANVALALELSGVSLLSRESRAALGSAAALRRWGLITLAEGPWGIGRAVTVDDAVIGALLGGPIDDAAAVAMAVSAGPAEVGFSSAGVPELSAALAAGHRLCWVENPPGGAGSAVAQSAFAAADIRCVAVDLARRPPQTGLLDAARIAVRYAGLRRAGLAVSSAELMAKDADGAAAIRLLATAPVPVVLVGACRWNASWSSTLPVTVRTAPLSTDQRLSLWRRHIDAEQVSDAVLMPYRLAPDQIDIVARHVIERARVTGQAVNPVMVTESVRRLGGSVGVRAGLGWAPTTFEDLQVPESTRQELQRLSAWVRLRDSVTAGGAVHGLGGKGSGVAALFTGSPGTGKTLAAHVIADTAGLDLMQVDLSGVIDKYIGETEKNLERIFAEAESLNVVLFFDEADSLFGKRSEVRDAHDRFANQEVSYLLQRMEQFDGITVLATNLKGNLDVAFSRRLHFIVHFPDPDEETRVRLWRQLLGQAGDLDPADPVDVPALAAAWELSGGDLRNIVLAAVYDAAAAECALGMRHVLAAAAREYSKLGRRMPSGLP